jgi:hypothetical protein
LTIQPWFEQACLGMTNPAKELSIMPVLNNPPMVCNGRTIQYQGDIQLSSDNAEDDYAPAMSQGKEVGNTC